MVTALKPSELGTALLDCFQSARAPMVHGAPGIGKSQIVMQTADAMFSEKYGYKMKNGVVIDVTGLPLDGRPSSRPWFREFRTAQRDPVDLTGVPHVHKNGTGFETKWATPGFLPKDARGGIFFFDEINRGPEMTQNACFTILDYGVVGEYVMPKTWIPAAAVNDNDAGARKMGSALQARFIHIDARTDLDDVVGGDPRLSTSVNKNPIAILRDWHPAVIAFLRFRPDLLHKFDPKQRVSPNPRGWEFISDLLLRGGNTSFEVQHHLFAGVVGEGAAIEFSGFLKLYLSLPSIDEILLAPDKVRLVTEPQTMFAVAAALGRRADRKSFGNAIKYMERLPVEFNFMMVMNAVHRDSTLQSAPEFSRWATAHSEVHV